MVKFGSELCYGKLKRVGKSTVHLVESNKTPDTYAPKFDEVVLIVSSLRSDVMISRAYNMSRKDTLNLVLAGFVSINGKVKEKNTDTLKEDGVITVRGNGKFVFVKIIGTTQKDKIRISIKKIQIKWSFI